MQFANVLLKNGKTITGYITNTYGSQFQILPYAEQTLTFASVSKSAIDKVEELRQLTSKEIELIQHYHTYSKEMADTEYQIRILQAHKNTLDEQREKQVEGLLKQAILFDQEEKAVLTVPDMEEFLNENGYKNLFLYQRNGVITLGEKEEVLFNNGYNQVPFMVQQKELIASVLNTKEYTKEVVVTFLQDYSFEAFHAKNEKEQSRESDYTEKSTKQTSETLNFSDIKDKLNEHGFQVLRKLQELRLLTIKNDGTMDFGDFGKFPLFNEILREQKVLVDFLNKEIPASFQTIIPIPIMKGVGGFFKTLENELEKLSKK